MTLCSPTGTTRMIQRCTEMQRGIHLQLWLEGKQHPLRHAAVDRAQFTVDHTMICHGMGGFPTINFIIMRFMTSHPHFSLRSVVLPLSLLFSHIVERMWLFTLQTLMLNIQTYTKCSCECIDIFYIRLIANTFQQNSHSAVHMHFLAILLHYCRMWCFIVTTQVCVVSLIKIELCVFNTHTTLRSCSKKW